MKKYNLILLITLALIAHSCFEDHTNYDYLDHEVISVKGIDASYNKVSMVDSLNITPTVSSSDLKAEFDYFWGIYETSVQGSAPKVDTISKELSLKYLIRQPAKTWVLVFGAKNKNTGYTKLITSTINVGTQFTRGWYVLKNEGNQSDLDLFLTPTSIEPASTVPNVYSFVNNRKLDGKGLGMNFESTYKSFVTGVNANTRAFFIFTDNDASIVNTNTMKEIKNFGQCFYTAPAVKSPGFIMVGSMADYFINNGQLHSIYTMSSNNGIFGSIQMRDAVNSPYYLSKYYITTSVNDPIFFDETSSSFISAGGAGTMLTAVTDAAGTAMSANKNNKNLLFMGISNTGSTTLAGVAVLADKTNPQLKILSTITPKVSAFKMVNDTLLSTSKLYNATKYAANIGDETLLYFVVGNEVWSRNLTNKFEQLQYKVPAGETITFIKHRKYTTTTEPAYAYNFIMVGSTDGTNYSIRMFNKSAGNLAGTPSVVLTGKGQATDVFYLSPSVNYTTYPNTY